MAKVYIELQAKDNVTPVTRKMDKNTEQAFNKMKANAKASTASMGSSIDKLKKHWVAFSAAAVAGVLVLRKAITAVMARVKEWINLSKVQEKAEITLAAALKASGEYTDSLNKRYQEFASSIQKVTTYGDEQVLGLMALIKNLGVSTGKVEAATKMAIGLAAATNRDVQSMAQYVALALQGEYTMLRRYIPALRSTTDATEQMKIVTDFAARGFKVAQETTRSYSDSLTQLRNLWLDLKEKLADVITRNEAILELIQRGKKYITELNEQLVKWYENNQAIIHQKTHEAINIIAIAVKDIVWALKALYKLRNVFKEVFFFTIPLVKNLIQIKNIIDKIRPPKMEGQGIIRMKIEKPELPLLEDETLKITAPALDEDYYKDQMEEWKQVTADFYDMKAAREKADLAHHKATLDEWGQVTKDFQEAERAQREQEIEEYLALEDIKAQAHQEELAWYEEVMAANEEYMKKYKANEDAKAASAFQTHLKMISYQKEAFAELAKGSGMAFAMYKVFSVAETLMKTYEAAQSSYAWASKWGGPPAGVAAAALAWAAGMARVAAIRSLEPAALYHEGGIVGRGSRPSRLVSSDVFAGEQRAHQGLAPDERPVIVRKDEGIFTPAQMAALGMGEGEGNIVIHNHLYVDGREVTKDQIHVLETDGVLLDRFRRALS